MTLSLKKFPLGHAAARHLADYPDGSPLFPGGMLGSAPALQKRLKTLEHWGGNRSALQAWLADQNRFAPLQAAQQAHLDAAGQPDALFVLTGQQPGLLGGPALWYYKAMSCAAWARALTKKLQRPVIPVFWVAGDDSDLAECNAVEWLEPAAPVSTFSLDFPHPREPIPMSLRSLSHAGANNLMRAAQQVWTGDVLALVESSYRPGRNMTESFLHLAQTFLGEEGVLFVDGFSAGEKAQPLLHRIVRAAPVFQKALGQSSRRLHDAGMGLQIPPRPGAVPAFVLEQGARARLFFSEAEGRLRVYVQGSEGRDLLPELFQHRLLHSALSRPLVAEELFPVLGHVLGPAELKYFAQLADVFPAFGMSAPPLAPRQQALCCPQTDAQRLAEWGFDLEDFPDLSPSRLRARLAQTTWENHPAAAEFPDSAFADFTSALRRYRDHVLPGAGGLDAGLRRLESAFARYREAARQAAFLRDGAETLAAFSPLLRWLGNGAQDRHINLLSLRNALGADGFSALTQSLRSEAAQSMVALYSRPNEGGKA